MHKEFASAEIFKTTRLAVCPVICLRPASDDPRRVESDRVGPLLVGRARASATGIFPGRSRPGAVRGRSKGEEAGKYWLLGGGGPSVHEEDTKPAVCQLVPVLTKLQRRVGGVCGRDT